MCVHFRLDLHLDHLGMNKARFIYPKNASYLLIPESGIVISPGVTVMYSISDSEGLQFGLINETVYLGEVTAGGSITLLFDPPVVAFSKFG